MDSDVLFCVWCFDEEGTFSASLDEGSEAGFGEHFLVFLRETLFANMNLNLQFFLITK